MAFVCVCTMATAGNLSDPNLPGKLRRCSDFSAIYYVDSPAKGAHMYLNIAVGTLNVFLSVLGLFANILVLTAYATNNRLRTMANMLLMTLACSDLLVTALVQPLYVVQIIKGTIGSHNCLLSTIDRLMTYFACGVSVLTVAIITIERFITLAYPFRYQTILTATRVKIVVTSTWLGIFTLIVSHVGFVPFDVLMFVGSSLLATSVVIVVSMWLWIHRQMQRHRNVIESTQMPSHVTVNRAQVFRNTKTIHLVVAVVLVSYFPALLMMLYYANEPTSFVLIVFVSPWSDTLMFANSSLNPVLVLWRKRHFMETVRNFFRLKSGRL